MIGSEIRGKQLGIVGLGRIGQAVAEKASTFGMTIAYHNPSRALVAGYESMSLDQLLGHLLTSCRCTCRCRRRPST
jgi:glyoxylate reductase